MAPGIEKAVLAILEENFQSYISGEEIARRLYVSRANICKIVKKLKNKGYRIESSTQKGYCLRHRENYLSDYLIRQYLNKEIQSAIEILPTIDSTNDYAKRRLAEGDSRDLLILSEEQTAGKGRRERSFYSPQQKGIYMSIGFHPVLAVEDVQLVTICAALAVCDAIENVALICADIKWLNDVYIRGKKVCGILTEGEIEIETLQYKYVVVGIGINVQREPTGLPAEIRDVYTSLSDHTSVAIDRNRLVAEVANAFSGYVCLLEENINNKERIIEKYKARSNVLGKKFIVNQNPARIYTAVDITSSGHLVAENEKKEELVLNSGEVSVAEAGHDS